MAEALVDSPVHNVEVTMNNARSCCVDPETITEYGLILILARWYGTYSEELQIAHKAGATTLLAHNASLKRCLTTAKKVRSWAFRARQQRLLAHLPLVPTLSKHFQQNEVSYGYAKSLWASRKFALMQLVALQMPQGWSICWYPVGTAPAYTFNKTS